VKCYPPAFTKWDKIMVDKGQRLTMRQFFDAFRENTSLNITQMYHFVTELDGPQKGKVSLWIFHDRLL
jgi:hypothetical protein